MSLRFVIGASGAGKSTYVYREVIAQSQEAPEKKFFVIVPDQFTMQTQMDLVTMHEKKGIMNIDVLSFTRLAHRIFEELGADGVPMLDDTGKSLIVRRVAAERREQMPLIGGNLGRTGYVHEVKSAISEFMQYGIGPQELEELAEYSRKRGQLYHKLQDLGVVYEGFLKFIQDRFLTAEELLEVLASLLPKSRLIPGSTVVFDGFTGFTPVQNKVILQLLRLAGEVTVTVTMDGRDDPFDQTGEQELFALSKKTAASLARLAREAGTEMKEPVRLTPPVPPRFQGRRQLAHLERCLFRYPLTAYDGEAGNADGIGRTGGIAAGSMDGSTGRTGTEGSAAGSADDGIRTGAADIAGPAGGDGAARKTPEEIFLLEAATQREEAHQIGIAIRRLVRETGCCYRDIAVICGDLSAYGSLVEREFSELDIPVYMDRTRGIGLNPFIEYMKSALQVRVQNYSFEAVFRYLRSGLADFSPDETDRLENYARSLGIRGRKKWEAPFVYRTRDMAKPMRELEELNALRARLVRQLEPLYGNFRKTADFAGGLYRFITQNGVQQKLKRFEEKFAREKDAVREREYAQIYRLVMDLLDQIVSLIGEEPAKAEEFAKILEAGFDEIRVGTIPQNVDRVVVGDMERTRLKPVKALFFAGVNDGYIPRNAGKGGILSELDREFLASSGKELAPSPRQQMYIQRLYLYLNMTKPSERLILSWARMGTDGRALRPSFLIGQMQKLFPGLRVRHPETAPALDQIQSLKDGRQYLAAGLRRYADGRMPEEEESAFLTLYHLYRRDQVYGVWSGRLTDTAFLQYRESPLTRAVAAALYGQTLLGSVSRLEQYAACAYSHFLRYGLQLSDQEEFSFEAVDLGNLFHEILEIFSKKLEENGYTWFDFPPEEGERLVAEAADACAAGYNNTVLFDSARNAYMITRIRRILSRTVQAMQYQLKKGSFVPERFEVSFSVAEELDAVNIALGEGERMRLRGRIDRMDVKEETDRVYVKVVDYKSGSRDFSLAALYYGLQLQLVVYLNAAMELTAKAHPGKEVIPAAMLYYRVQDPVIEADREEMTPEEVNAQILRTLRATGVVNASEDVVKGLDGSFTDRSDVVPVERKKDGGFSVRSGVMEETDFRTVSAFVEKKIRQAGRQILDGRIALDPYVQGNRSACDFCSYRKVCGFDRQIGGYLMRELEDIKEEEALVRIREEVSDGGEIHGGSAAGH